MARVFIKEPRQQEAHFGLYRTSAGGDESIFVRRKVGEPTDYLHSKSVKLKRQRENMAVASRHYAQLSPTQKAITRHEFEEVEFINSHGKTETKLLMGRQLFVSREIHSLNATGTQIVVPYEVCIILTDEALNPLEGELWLKYLIDEEWKNASKEEIVPGHWLFSQVPRDAEAYRVYGEADGYLDPELPEHQNMSAEEMLAHHYHILPIDEDILYRLYQLPYSRLQFVFYGYGLNRNFKTLETLSQIVFYLKIDPTDFQGSLTLGFSEIGFGVPPAEWLGKRVWQVSWNEGSTYYYLAVLDASMIEYNVWYRKWIYRLGEIYGRASGYMDTWLLTEPIIPL